MPKRGRPPKPEDERKPTATIRVDAEVARMLGIIATATDEDTSDIASPILRAGIHKRYVEVLRTLQDKARRDADN